ncbi:MAG: FtsX-like permease family protein [Alphaproteobacteria bacterium]|nr:FtsX-like permease family protein [Alphaproteobacteria bacterium]
MLVVKTTSNQTPETSNKKMTRYDIAFSSDDTHRFLPWLIALMVAMAALLLCFGASINGWVVDRHGAYSSNFTVEIPAQDEDSAPKIDKIRDSLQKIKGVARVSQVSDEHMQELLKPWFDGDMMKDLPVPAVFEVAMEPKAPAPNYPELQKTLSDIIAGTQVDARERWVASFTQFSSALQSIVGGMAAVIALAMAVTIAFSSRASLHLHSQSVGLLHSIGAEDGYIASQFQREAFLLTLRGALIGCISAGALYVAAGHYVASLNVASLPSLAMTPLHLALLLVLPLLCGVVAWMTAYVTVRRQLQKVL